MSDQSSSFIDEVTDELRRERLFGLFRRYGWVAVLVILGIVGGTIWVEVSAHNRAQTARQWGDAILVAEEGADPAAIIAVDPQGSSGRAAVAALLAAGEWTERGAPQAAAESLRRVIAQGAGDPVLDDLARLKLVMVAGEEMDPSERDAILAELSRSGAPFELLALEQKAVALVEAGRSEDAISLIRQIQQKDGLSETLRRRLSEMMITLGGEPERAGAMAPGALPAE